MSRIINGEDQNQYAAILNGDIPTLTELFVNGKRPAVTSGVARLTESGVARLTESGVARILE